MIFCTTGISLLYIKKSILYLNGGREDKRYLKRFGAQTIAKFFVCIFVMEQ